MISEKIKIENIPAIIWGEPSDRLFIFVHGKLSNKTEARDFAEIATIKGFQVLSFDLPEHGERKYDNYQCTVQNGVKDLETIINFVDKKWNNINLFACSLGAYFSLLAFKNITFSKCLFLSPILDMERLIKNMMRWTNISEIQLQEQKLIPTSIGETLSWEYYEYVLKNPISKWNSETHILYGALDNLTERDVLDSFTDRFDCSVKIVPDGEHYFHTKEQISIFNKWITDNIKTTVPLNLINLVV